MSSTYNHINKTVDFMISAVFIILETALYAIFAWLDCTSFIDTTFYKFAAICLCLLFSAYRVFREKGDALFIFFAMCFTVLSDTFTLVINDHFVLGVAFFIPAQLLYAARIRAWSKKPPYKSIICRFILITLLILGLAIFEALEPLALVTAIYFSMLVYNAVESIFFAKSPSQILFTVGLWLFICCDVCVGLYNLSSVFPVNIPYETEYVISILMWIFYLPSQVLIVFSSNQKFTARNFLKNG